LSVVQLRSTMGGIHLSNPLVLASGVQGSSLSGPLEALRFGAGAAVTKSVGLTPREGYVEPTLAETDSGLLNAVGLPNPGANAFASELASLRGRSLPLLVSIYGRSAEEFGETVELLDANDFLGYELNLSCPHVADVGTEVGHDPEEVGRVVKATKSRTSKPVFAKLSPNTERLIEVADAAVRAGVDGLTAINTVKAMAIDVVTGRPVLSNLYGGLSGNAIRPVGLRCVYELREKFSVPIMGCGGVSTWEHVIQFVLAGANAVQVGTATMGNPAIFNDLNLGVLAYLERKGIDALESLVGAAHRGGVRERPRQWTGNS
jgi:dihydroorotate dehydrogenase (NAD+) catalytic subunit